MSDLNFLDDEKWKLLSQYYDANNLLIYCLNNSGEVDDKLKRDVTITNRCHPKSPQVLQLRNLVGSHSKLETKNGEQGTGVGQTTTIFNIETLNAPNAVLNLGGTLHGDQTDTQNH